MEFIETPTFTRLITDLLTDDEYRLLQNVLVEDPERGALIRGGGGIRKLRYALAGWRQKWRYPRDLLLGYETGPDLPSGRLP